MDIYTEVGHTALWIGPGSGVANWNATQIGYAARAARALGIDTICPKRAEGTVKWYGNAAQLRAERAAAHDQGAGFVAHFYSDGPKYGIGFVDQEAAVIIEMLDAAGFVCLDVEAEWDGQVEAAARLADRLRGHPGILLINPWANPDEHAWGGVADHMNSIADGWIPQQYNDYLAHADESVYNGPILPGVDLSQEFGVNHPVDIAHAAMAAGHRSLFLWEYENAKRDHALVRSLVAVMEGHAPPPPPAPTPGERTATVMPGDSLSIIAARYGVALSAIESANTDAIRAACSQHGVPFSYDRLWPGMILRVP